MRYIGTFILVSVLIGCSSQPKDYTSKDPVIINYDESKIPRTLPEKEARKGVKESQYVGVSGHFSRPPLFSSPEFEDVFNRCDEFTVTAVNQSSGRVIVTIRQGENVLQVVGLNGREFQGNALGQVPLLNKYFVKNLDVLRSRGERYIASVSERLCTGKLWKGMTKEELLFVKGKPKKKTEKAWTYYDEFSGTAVTYKFNDNRLIRRLSQ